MDKTTDFQRQYYSQSASKYDQMHVVGSDLEHTFALHIFESIIKFLNAKDILDVGSGTGRVIEFLKFSKNRNINVLGIEPVEELRKIGYQKGISPAQLLEGDGTKIAYSDNYFDISCSFGVLHHVKNPELVISEMLRVSSKGIFISDSNNFGQGSLIERSIKQILNFFNLWWVYNLIRTKGKGYQISEGDGLFYSYSVFNNMKYIKKHCSKVHIINSSPNTSNNLYKSASHVVVIGIK